MGKPAGWPEGQAATQQEPCTQQADAAEAAAAADTVLAGSHGDVVPAELAGLHAELDEPRAELAGLHTVLAPAALSCAGAGQPDLLHEWQHLQEHAGSLCMACNTEHPISSYRST